MTITCPHCGKRHSLTEDFVQKASKVRCSRCGEKFFLDELASQFIKAETDSHEKAQKSQEAVSSIRENSRHSRPPVWNRLHLAIGIAAVFVIVAAAAFYFLHVAPENKFRAAMRGGEEAENAGRWDDALNAYYRAERIKPRDAGVAGAWESRRAIEQLGNCVARVSNRAHAKI